MPCVLNRHHFRDDPDGLPIGSFYVGRNMDLVSGTRARDLTILGNRFKKGEHPHPLKAYKRWLFNKVRTDPEVQEAMRQIDEDSYLVCSCSPSPCHAEIIRGAWWWMLEQGLL